MFHPIRILLIVLLGGLLPACSGHYYGHYQSDHWYDDPPLIHHRVPVIIDQHPAPVVHQRTVILHTPKTVIHQKRPKNAVKGHRPHHPHQPAQNVVIKPVTIKPKVVTKGHHDHRKVRNNHAVQRQHTPVSRQTPALERGPRHNVPGKDFQRSDRQHGAVTKQAIDKRSQTDAPGKGLAQTRSHRDTGQALRSHGKGLERLGIVDTDPAQLVRQNWGRDAE